MFFTEDGVERMELQILEMKEKYKEILGKFVQRNYECSKAEEFAKHGYGRRLRVMVRCIENVYELLPPDYDGIPVEDTLIEATIYLHAFIHSTFGCCDNLAWIWVLEKSVTQNDGSHLTRNMVGLRTENLLKSYPNSLKSFLDTQEEWYLRLKDYRNALSHRIPIYIPPHIISREAEPEYLRIETAASEALNLGDLAEYFRLKGEQKKLAYFVPWFTHSFVEESDFVFFHPHMLNDFNTIYEISKKFLEELEH